jgi:hypothetical protein
LRLLAEQVHQRRHRDDPVGDLRQQQVGQCEVAEVVGAELALETVDGSCERHGHDARVVDQDVDRVDPVGELADRRQILQIEPSDLDVTGHACGGGGALGRGAYGEDHLGADSGEFACRDLAKAAVGAGDDDGASGERRKVGGGPAAHGHSLLVAGRRIRVRGVARLH